MKTTKLDEAVVAAVGRQRTCAIRWHRLLPLYWQDEEIFEGYCNMIVQHGAWLTELSHDALPKLVRKANAFASSSEALLTEQEAKFGL